MVFGIPEIHATPVVLRCERSVEVVRQVFHQRAPRAVFGESLPEVVPQRLVDVGRVSDGFAVQARLDVVRTLLLQPRFGGRAEIVGLAVEFLAQSLLLVFSDVWREGGAFS